MRRQVAGIEAVLAAGEVVGSLVGHPKESAGLHWPSILAGSEGTLAVVTAARLHLVPRYAETVTALVGCVTLDAAVQLLGRLRESLSGLDSVEIIGPTALQVVTAHLRRQAPVEPSPEGALVLIECVDHVEQAGTLGALLDAATAAGEIDATAMATDSRSRAGLTQFRDRMTEALAAAASQSSAPVFKLDVAVRPSDLDQLVEVATATAIDDGSRLYWFGHLAEGNLHLNLLDTHDTERVATTILGSVAELGGTISAEHGIGVAKARWLPLVRTSQDLAAQWEVKSSLDPSCLLNPGVIWER
jgi:FAD/FMN-containing dehydrogenase